ncbi:MAG: hypothetical protein AB8B46_05720 [Candidatus Midichloriaceae bacterium]
MIQNVLGGFAGGLLGTSLSITIAASPVLAAYFVDNDTATVLPWLLFITIPSMLFSVPLLSSAGAMLGAHYSNIAISGFLLCASPFVYKFIVKDIAHDVLSYADNTFTKIYYDAQELVEEYSAQELAQGSIEEYSTQEL